MIYATAQDSRHLPGFGARGEVGARGKPVLNMFERESPVEGCSPSDVWAPTELFITQCTSLAMTAGAFRGLSERGNAIHLFRKGLNVSGILWENPTHMIRSGRRSLVRCMLSQAGLNVALSMSPSARTPHSVSRRPKSWTMIARPRRVDSQHFRRRRRPGVARSHTVPAHPFNGYSKPIHCLFIKRHVLDGRLSPRSLPAAVSPYTYSAYHPPPPSIPPLSPPSAAPLSAPSALQHRNTTTEGRCTARSGSPRSSQKSSGAPPSAPRAGARQAGARRTSQRSPAYAAPSARPRSTCSGTGWTRSAPWSRCSHQGLRKHPPATHPRLVPPCAGPR